MFLAAGVLALAATLAWLRWRPKPDAVPTPSATPFARGGESTEADRRLSPELAAQWQAIEARERHIAETVWTNETVAAECARTFEDLWDALNAATNKLDLAAAFPIGRVILPAWDPPQGLVHGIEQRRPAGRSPPLDPAAWRALVAYSQRAGWRIAQTEFRHRRFEPDPEGRPLRSAFLFAANLTNAVTSARATIEGDLGIEWSPDRDAGGSARVRQIDASGLRLKTRPGPPPFELLLAERIAPPRHSQAIDPLILHDLDGDGLSEILLVARNLVFRRRGPESRFEPAMLCHHPPSVVYAAVLADFDGDGAVDLLAEALEGLVLVSGSPQGTFDTPPRLAWQAAAEVRYPMVLTCGDIDRDGDLDVFLGQYKDPYEGGATPTPYYRANDGNPSYLLRNDGAGHFTEVTEAAGLAAHRHRRTYTASFADLDADGHLDLLTVSDFAGLDLYRNDGRGGFTDTTAAWVDEPHAFGMAHALADFNADGRLDLLMIGMPSATVDRLDHLGSWRPDDATPRPLRSAMTFGNRLYLARTNGGFDETRLGRTIARSGWSWGCSAPDLDNDGYPDVYVANGLESRRTVRDYEAEYWLHDQHVGTAGDDPAAYLYFKAKIARTRGRGQSYGGYEKNRLYLNLHGDSFLEAGHLFGVALEQDSRNVVADDLDGDGRVDLLVTTFETWPDPRQTLRIFGNTLADTGHWIGFRFRDRPGGRSSVGVTVRISAGGRRSVRQQITGDSHRSQHAGTLHFGLGAAVKVDRVEIRWPDGRETVMQEVSVDRYHRIEGPP